MSHTTKYWSAPRSLEVSSLREVRRRLKYGFAIGDQLTYGKWRVYRIDQYRFGVANLETLAFHKFSRIAPTHRDIQPVNTKLEDIIQQIVKFIDEQESQAHA